MNNAAKSSGLAYMAFPEMKSAILIPMTAEIFAPLLVDVIKTIADKTIAPFKKSFRCLSVLRMVNNSPMQYDMQAAAVEPAGKQ